MSATLDLVDALASAIALATAAPAPRVISAERAAYASFLRESGVEPWELEEKLAEFDREATREVA
jgi:hypothetical protein